MSDIDDVKKLWSTQKLPDGTLSIKKYKGSDTDVIIPESIGGKVVSTIGQEAFAIDRPRSAYHKVLS